MFNKFILRPDRFRAFDKLVANNVFTQYGHHNAWKLYHAVSFRYSVYEREYGIFLAHHTATASFVDPFGVPAPRGQSELITPVSRMPKKQLGHS